MALPAVRHHGRVTLQQLASLLEPALGLERSAELVAQAAKTLLLPLDLLTFDQGDQLLEELSRHPDLVGVSARFARRRLKLARVEDELNAAPEPDDEPAPPSTHEPASGLHRIRVSRDELVGLMEKTLGREKAEETIRTAGQQLGVVGALYDYDQCLDILERLSRSPGLVGITARFAKARFILKLKGP